MAGIMEDPSDSEGRKSDSEILASPKESFVEEKVHQSFYGNFFELTPISFNFAGGGGGFFHKSFGGFSLKIFGKMSEDEACSL